MRLYLYEISGSPFCPWSFTALNSLYGKIYDAFRRQTYYRPSLTTHVYDPWVQPLRPIHSSSARLIYPCSESVPHDRIQWQTSHLGARFTILWPFGFRNYRGNYRNRISEVGWKEKSMRCGIELNTNGSSQVHSPIVLKTHTATCCFFHRQQMHSITKLNFKFFHLRNVRVRLWPRSYSMHCDIFIFLISFILFCEVAVCFNKSSLLRSVELNLIVWSSCGINDVSRWSTTYTSLC